MPEQRKEREYAERNGYVERNEYVKRNGYVERAEHVARDGSKARNGNDQRDGNVGGRACLHADERDAERRHSLSSASGRRDHRGGTYLDCRRRFRVVQTN